jgi:hypothetical protein
VETKVCSRCHKPKPLSDFGLLTRSKDGHESRCRECNRDRIRDNAEARKARAADSGSGNGNASVTHIDDRLNPRQRAARMTDAATPPPAPPTTARKGARSGTKPTKLTPEVQNRICIAIAGGSHFEPAARYAGISPDSFWRWLKRGQTEDEGPFRDFAHAVFEAEARAEVRAVALWQSQMDGNWQAIRDFLARRHPQRWGPMDRTMEAGSRRDDYEEPVDDQSVIDSGVAFVARLAESRRSGA